MPYSADFALVFVSWIMNFMTNVINMKKPSRYEGVFSRYNLIIITTFMLGQGPLVYWFYFRDGLFVIYLASNLSLVVVGEFITLTKKCSSTAFRKSISKHVDKSNRTKVRKSSSLQRTLAVERCL